MARPNAQGRVLTFHKPSKRWRKIIDGKAVYFGRGTYSDALKKYNAYLEEQRQKHGRDRALGIVRALLELPTPGDPDSEDLNTGTLETSAALADLANHPDERIRALLAQSLGQASEALQGAEPSAVNNDAQASDSEIGKAIDAYLAEQRRRHELTKKQPEALPAKRRLGVHGFKSIQSTLTQFKRWCSGPGRVATLGDAAQLERVLKRYRNHLDQQVTDGNISTETASNQLRQLKPLIKWLWQNRHIDDMPRNADDVLRRFTPQRKAKAIEPDNIRKLFDAADDQLKTLIAVCLNCGMYVSEAAQIRLEHYNGNYIARRRGKTGVPAKYKLWPVTKTLIEMTKTAKRPEEYLWKTRQGYPLVHETPSSTSNSVHRPWRELCHRVGVKAQWSNLRDTAATEIERIGKRQGNATLVSQFLAHADGRTAKWYIDDSGSPFDLDSSTLDAAIDEMAKTFNLKL